MTVMANHSLEPPPVGALGVLAVDIRWPSAKTPAWLSFRR
jgi:hypothetical protein